MGHKAGAVVHHSGLVKAAFPVCDMAKDLPYVPCAGARARADREPYIVTTLQAPM